MDYLDFEIEIGPGGGSNYPVAVIRSPAGEARETIRLPFDGIVLQNHLLELQNALLRSGIQHRQALSPDEQQVRDFGQALFDALFAGNVRSRYDVSLERAQREGKGLRLKLAIQSADLAALPWEFLYDSRQAEYLCLSLNTPLVRYLQLPRHALPLAVAPPLRILAMITSPHGLPPLNIERERQRLQASLGDLQSRGLVDLIWLPGQTWHDVQQALRSGPWHIFHFMGHGGFDRAADEGFLALADEDGEVERLSATKLGRLLADHASLRLVLLNACEGARGSVHDIFSSTAAILVRRGIPAVLAMQYAITDSGAIAFARFFYEALADGMPVDAAVTEARKSLSLSVPNSVEWGVPVLCMHAPDGKLFNIQRSIVSSAKAETAESQVRAEAQPPELVRQVGQAAMEGVDTAPSTAQPAPIQTPQVVQPAQPTPAPRPAAHPAAVPTGIGSGKSRATIVQWMILNAMGWAVGLTLAQVLRSSPFLFAFSFPFIAGALTGATVMAIVGSMQWLILRNHVPRAAQWVWATTLSGVIGIYWLLRGDMIDNILTLSLVAAMTGAVTGIAQGWSVRDRIFKTGWLVLASAAGFMGVLDLTVALPPPFIGGAMGGAIYGIITSFALASVFRRSATDYQAEAMS